MKICIGSDIVYNNTICKKNKINTNNLAELPSVLLNIKKILNNLNIKVIQPKNVKVNTCMALWMRDSFINIDDKLYLLPNSYSKKRIPEEELKTINIEGEIVSHIYIDGGDIIQHNNTIFIGIGTRTKLEAYEWLKKEFPNKNIIKINHSALHLDCCFCILPNNTIIYSKKYIKSFPSLLRKKYTVTCVEEFINKNTNPNLATNLLIINNTILAADLTKFHRFYNYLESQGFHVILIPYYNIWKHGGGIRCLTQWIEKDNLSIS
tara:strand:- start:1397 stop:2188 length:792 start_codon:yes stop_codon:yes gene_type:complete